jgi:hypothetical protein
MKHLLNGVAIAAALAIAGPVWAQQQTPNPNVNPSGNSMGMPGPNPGGPGLTPYTGGGYATQPTTSASPPVHQPLHPAAHTHAMHHFHKGMAAKAAQKGDTTAALNREELARINAGNLSNPPPAAAPMTEGPPPEGAPPPQPRSGSSKYLPTGGPKVN